VTFAALAPVNVNVELVIVAGFIALLNVAVMSTVLGHTKSEASGGVTEVTAGGVRGSVGLPAPTFLSASPHPAIARIDKIAEIQILLAFDVCIRFSPFGSKYPSRAMPQTLPDERWRNRDK
jgi:hypothetical protein